MEKCASDDKSDLGSGGSPQVCTRVFLIYFSSFRVYVCDVYAHMGVYMFACVGAYAYMWRPKADALDVP